MGFGRLLGHPLSNSMERANPSIFTVGPPSKDGCQMLRSSAKKTNKGTFKNSRVKEVFFFFFFFLLSSTNAPRWQLMISFPLLQKFKLQGIVTSAGFRSRFHFPVCGSLPSLQAGAGAGVQSADFSSDAAGSLLSSLTVDISAIRISIEICLLLPCIYITYIIYYLCHSLIFYLFIHFKPAKEVE